MAMDFWNTLVNMFTSEDKRREQEFLNRMVEEGRSINTYSSYTHPKLKEKERNEFIKYLMNSTTDFWDEIPKDFAIENNTYMSNERLGQTLGLMGEGMPSTMLAAPLAVQANTSAIEPTLKSYPQVRKEIEEFTGSQVTPQSLFDVILPHEGRHATTHERIPFEFSPDYVTKYFNINKYNPFWTFTDNAEHMRRVIQNYAKNYPSSHAKTLDTKNEFIYEQEMAPKLYDEIATRAGDYGDKIRNLFFIENPRDRQIMENYLRTLHNYWGD